MRESRLQMPALWNPAPAGLVTVVSPGCNCEACVREAIDSVLNQTFTDYEIIVVNDASTDSTPEIPLQYEAKA